MYRFFHNKSRRPFVTSSFLTVYFNLMCKYFVGILLNASTSTDENDAIDVEMQCDMLFIVASLCEGDTHRKVKL